MALICPAEWHSVALSLRVIVGGVPSELSQERRSLCPSRAPSGSCTVQSKASQKTELEARGLVLCCQFLEVSLESFSG